ncbi:MAG TPA: GntR family transcriptional regulator [Candidatus Limnocylindria bacterium]|nr:GntR family transcriptional regulator [Candidatus Limnocylindria bacterium]
MSGDAPVPSSERVYQALRHRILAGMLEPGSRLVELQLATEFTVSRTPVREALKRLTAEGLIRVDPVRGIVVSDVDARELEEIFVVREVLDGLAARLAAGRVSSTDLTKLHLLMDMMRDAVRTGQWEGMVQANIKFHDVLHQAAGNERLRHLTRNLLDFVRRFSNEAFASQERAAEVLAEHEEIIRAMELRDPDLAEKVARRHVESAREYIASQYLSQSVEPGVDGNRLSVSVGR